MKRSSIVIRYTALVGMMAASVECAKLALAALPNIEAVSLLLALYSYVFGFWGVLAALVFVCIEPMVWGMGTWVVSYLIYWPLLALVFCLLRFLKVRNRFIVSGAVVLLTAFFGVLTSFVDVGLFSGSLEGLFYRFGIYYLRGVGFYLTHTISNAVIFLLLYPILLPVLEKIKARVFSD